MSSVNLRVYDISGGAAKRWSSILIGRQIQGVWHSGIEVFGFEYFYGGGIVKMKPENVEMTFGITPTCVHDLGRTKMTRIEFEKFLITAMPLFRKEVYNLTEWNCNHFANYCCEELLDRQIPQYILDLPQEVCKTFMGKLILNFLKMIGGSAPVAVDDPSHPSKTASPGQPPRSGLPRPPVRVQSERVAPRCRRNSCPASPIHRGLANSAEPRMRSRPAVAENERGARGTTRTARRKSVANTVVPPRNLLSPQPSPQATTPEFIRSQHDLLSASDRSAPDRSAPDRSAPDRRLITLPVVDSLRDTPHPQDVQRVKGSPIAGAETEVLFSPVHRRLYELERDLYAPKKQTARRKSLALAKRPEALVC
ncbi:PPPDE peptidase domain protein 2 [Gregarina niphandrodes]|uniref:PPPDE peptidase domain protein 2 n=1 Tax=Gregarina niphandrodes TaxID=110365 RepID=A0A023B808_GRENI|nr:PPPDE peptidase domain protein 2 [Gregarina niphandrodes]EZG68180.1 PPPDE peptidase domain protein 2 [Gregarina niphandrodes]|eukprot:XP_011130074.1 PPPDE peptidase domain protein 2 [Gregarina niphandrodes]